MAPPAATPCSNSCCTTVSLFATGCSPFPAGFSGLRMKKTTDSSLNLMFHCARHVDLPSNVRLSCRCDASTKATTVSTSAGNDESKLSIVFVSAEVAPWSKTGGLGDVISGLPPALAALGHRVMTIAPRYDQYKDAWDTELLVDVNVRDQTEKVRFFHSYERGVDRVFVDHPCFLEKVWGVTGSKLYGAETGSDYFDNQFRFALFNHAAIEAPLQLNLPKGVFNGPYGQDVMFVANDWHSALVPLYLKAKYKPRGLFMNAKVAICIHNIAYQGRFAFQDFYQLNLPNQFKSSFDFMDGYDKPVKGRKINWLKAGLLESDIVLTVSPTYASELLSGVERGVELDSILRKTGITGIINGMDVEEWDPSSDKFLDVKYDVDTVFEAKPSLKEALQAEVGLPINPDVPVFGFIGRLEEQKGSDILAEAITQIIEHDIQLIVLGTGKSYLEKQLRELELKYPKKARGIVKFNAALGHMIIAGADFMLVPSRFEPCGLVQLFSMRYGSIPIVASTGGLVDTVTDGVTGLQIGKSFNVKCEEVDPSDVEALAATVKRAINVYKTPDYYQMVETCMSQDLSWKEPAKEWEEMLVSLAAQQCETDESFEFEEATRQNVVMAA